MSDIEKAFTFLHDNIPSWFTNVNEIEEKVTQLLSERKVPVTQSMPIKRRTGSVESIRDIQDTVEDANPSTTAQQNLYNGRKRKTPSILSRASGPSKYRSRVMIVVQYDGEVQKSFETLVRSIGTGRNMLRKGKMVARMEALAEMAGPDDADDTDDSGDDAIMAKIGYRHRAALPSMRPRGPMRGVGSESKGPSSGTSVELFDSTDKALEHAQGLCERAAHQALRDGNCRKEMDGVRKHLEGVLEAANKEVEKYNARKDKESSLDELETQSLPPSVVLPAKPILPTIRSDPAAAHTTLKAVEIEVDDDEFDDVDFVMPPIRLTSRV
ncbi:hypothetical protein K504DRAFT_380734 [Pleomassaria siparia CBS 279.74]|uniref:Uncharacterized protein n=1 Tax=Pleomassaria siparia CBS 279.74 TaxID=1314801 RepID=A0A6G1K7C1_9PLEO|nr:hypothetical protein K504DRAFT_380734 [Pleomassaria siparia CBS 279.74]